MARYSLLVLLSAVAVRAAIASQAPLTITLRSPVEMASGKPVTLGDVASIAGEHPSSEKAAAMVLAGAPPPGGTTKIRLSYVKAKLGSAGLKNAKIAGPDAVVVSGKCLRVTANDLCQKAKDHVLSLLSTEGGTYETSVQRMPRDLILPSAAVEIKPRLAGSAARPGANTVALDAVVAGKVVATTSAVIEVKAIAEVMVAAERIRQGGEVTASSISWEPRDIGRAPNAITRTEFERTAGMVARRTIQPGSVITASDVEPPLAVRRGDRVDAVVRCGGVTLRTTAEARQDGRAGDLIHVRPTVSQTDLRARISGPGAVIVLQ